MSLQLTLRVADPASLETPLLIVPVTTDVTFPAPLGDAVDAMLTAALATGDFTGKRDEMLICYPNGPIRRVLLIGMGESEKLTAAAVRRAAMVGGKRARTIGVEHATVLIPASPIGVDRTVQSLAEGMAFGAWQYTELKKPADPPKPKLGAVELVASASDSGHEPGLARGRAIAAGQAFARGLQVLPADTCTPVYLAGQAEELARRHGFTATILDRAALEAEGMHAILAVAKGSANEPRFIALEYQGAEGPPVVLVGKGVTFDTGGISIKPALGMEEMKYDMSGAAAVLGTFEMLGQLKPKVHVIGLVPTAENMVSSTAYRPGDVVRSHFGKTIEVLNTDAEGRLLLADALSYARRYQPAAVVDCATLTGAVVIGLGHTATGVMGTDPALIDELRRAGDESGERVWELPLWDEYRELIKSDIADVKNTGGRPAGSITAGWFLREFVEGYPWAHLDIAGTAYSDRESAMAAKGPMGLPVRLFSEFLLARS